jgi:hypothetical protein
VEARQHPQVVAPTAASAVLQANVGEFPADPVVCLVEDFIVSPKLAFSITRAKALAPLTYADIVIQLIEIQLVVADKPYYSLNFAL